MAAPARVLDIGGTEATVDIDGRRRRASTLLAPGIRPGDWALVAAGNVVRRIDADEAADLGRLLAGARRAADDRPGGRS